MRYNPLQSIGIPEAEYNVYQCRVSATLSMLAFGRLAAGCRTIPKIKALPHKSHIPRIVDCAASTMAATEEGTAPSAALTHIDAASYESQLAAKQTRIEDQFKDLNPPKLEIFRSKPDHYRMRAEFTVWHEKDDMYYVMYEKNAAGERVKVRMDQFPVASELVNQLMTLTLQGASTVPILRHKLFQANFHTACSGQSVVTLIYHKKLEEAEWTAAAKELRTLLATAPGATVPPHIVGRSRKQKICLDADEVEEVLDVDGQALRYVQIVGAFSQPNAGVSRCMLGWAKAATRGSQDHDLLELYCGNGNFTVALAPNFRRVVATEVSKSAVAAARRNFEANGVTNGFVARMSSEEFVEAWHSGRQYTRLSGIDLAACDFKTIFVDPPRAGLDEATLKLLREFERVVYVSCNPETLHRDVSAVADRFEIGGMAMFDQFPYTHHVECGVYLVKKGGEEESEEGKRVAKRKADEAAELV